ncbi:type II and III secretion system protein family protein [Alteripontixanthobacter maritimus]|nr:type II and III secretion system protein family protein [Alteripontixanthobacter maritimus]
MKRRFFATALLSSLAAAPLAMAPVATATAQQMVSPTQDLVLSIGKGQLVRVPGTMADVFIANDGVADVQIKSQSQLYLFGKAGGETTVYASNSAGDVIWSANVRVGNNIDSVDQMLGMAMPQAKIAVSTMGANTVLLTGTVTAPEDAAEAERLVGAFLGEEANVISRLRMATPLQVNLQVRFAEVNRSLVREIGSSLNTRDNTGGLLLGARRGSSAPTISGGANGNLPVLDASASLGLPPGTISLPFDVSTGEFVTGGTQYSFPAPSAGQTALRFAGRLFGMDIGGAFDVSERLGLLTSLAQPNLTALSGETAEFLAGGEFPIPVNQGLGTTTIDYRKFGVSLSYTPTVLANGRISLRVRPEISELSSQNAVVQNGFQIPSLTVRRAETTVELGSGQSFMIAGLMSNSAQNTIDKAPGLGDVPILGNLFRSTSFRKGETELVIIVTPYLVNPVNANEIKLPTDGYQSPNELQRLIGFRDNDGISGAQRPMPTAAGAVAPNPNVSRIEAEDLLPGAADKPARRADKKQRKKSRSAKADAPAPTPGFDLN